MKKFFLFLMLLPLLALGQDKPVVVYGRVTSDYPNVNINDITQLYIRYVTKHNSYLTSPDDITHGFYTCKLKRARSVTVESNIHDFYAPTVTENVNGRDSIRIDIKLVPKPYIYTATKAKEDLAADKVQLITYDSIENSIGQKYDLKKKFGFKYLLLKEPNDDDFRENHLKYNTIVEQYLNMKYGRWRPKFEMIQDSIVNLAADNYGAKNHIDLNLLKVPSYKKLPIKVQERISYCLMVYRGIYSDAPRKKQYRKVLKLIKTATRDSELERLDQYAVIKYKRLIPELIKLITDSTKVGLEDYKGVNFCWESIPEGGIPGTREHWFDDLCSVSGRANSILKKITAKDFGDAPPGASPKWLAKLQNRWAYWLLQLQDKK